MDINTSIEYVQGVGPKKSSILISEIGVRTVGDALAYFPYRYVDRSKFYKINECVAENTFVQICGIIISYDILGDGKNRRLVAKFADQTGMIELVWFSKLRYVEERIRINTKYIVFGKPTLFGRRVSIVHPELESYSDANVSNILGLMPLYNSTEKMKASFLASNGFKKIVFAILNNKQLVIPETLPKWLLEKCGLLDRYSALKQIHHPENFDLLRKAQERLKFEELLYIQLSIMRQTKIRQLKYQGFVFSKIGNYFNRFYHEFLPFSLTDAQKRVMREIRADMATGKQMNRLIQGDVGSGKTMIALLSSIIALDNGYQACIMAPTEILATQHYSYISDQLLPLGVNVQLLTGSVSAKKKNEILKALYDGSINLVVGTHALIEDSVVFNNLGLVVIDEQHRFGVAQRAKLWKKNVCPPHILVMTATPIPRTLAMTIYGDLDVSVIDELPPGRKPIATYHFNDSKRNSLYQFVRKQLESGHQVYIVYPLITENEKLDFKNLQDGYLTVSEVFSDYRVVMVHGKMKPAEKEYAMQLFSSGKAHIMVATTVIEVGVNVPNANVMIIESAERFGLSQLHQLRGRVGRGAEQSYCILMSKVELSNETQKRLSIMCDSTDGFVIAEADLQMRGPGDIEGLQQSGLPFNLRIANLATDGQILQYARMIAKDIIDEDPTLSSENNVIIKHELERLKNGNINWGVIS